MSENAIKAYQGKDFTITLQSSPGSTGYAWCLTSLPPEFALFSYEVAANPGTRYGGPSNQVFRFFALSEPRHSVASVEFTMIRLFDPRQIGEKISVSVTVIPYNEEDGLEGFVKYSDNAAEYTPAIPYGYPLIGGVGSPADLCVLPNCDSGDACVKYGYPYAGADPYVKYGYPAMEIGLPPYMKYGYFGMKYGYPGC